MVNWVRVKELHGEIGEEDFAEVIGLFLDEVESTLGQLDLSLGPSRIEQMMHFLKGSAWNVGFTTLGECCQRGELLAAGGRAVEIDFAQVREIYAVSKRKFFEGLPTLGGLSDVA